MPSITLICTVHKYNGKCNSHELLQIIDRISPDVIYEELPANLFSVYYQESKFATLETKAIKSYMLRNPTPHIPVDLNVDDLVDLKLKTEISKMHNVFRNNVEYENLWHQHHVLTSQLGFSYLNSNKYMTFFENSQYMEDVILRRLNNPELMETYRVWLNLIDRRENSMIKNIYQYGNKHKPKNALFLLGATHRKSIIQKANEVEMKSNLKFKWIINSI